MTVLANEQVIDGRGWRSDAPVERRKLNQWFLRITDYADELLEGLKTLDRWPDKVRLMQENWIGKSRGLRLTFAVRRRAPDGFGDGVDGLHDPAGHALRRQLRGRRRPTIRWPRRWPRADPARRRLRRGMPQGRHLGGRDRDGREAGLRHRPARCVHPFDPTLALPVWIANFILMDYGTGRDLRLPGARPARPRLRPQVRPAGDAGGAAARRGPRDLRRRRRGLCRARAASSTRDFMDGLDVEAAKAAAIARRPRTLGLGEGATVYRLRDWGVARQRGWGCPIPVVHCAACGVVPVPETELPVRAARRPGLQPPGQRRWRAIRPGSTPPAPHAAARPSARPTRSTPSSTRPGTSPASPIPHAADADRQRPRPTTGCRSTSTSAASSTRCCTCSTPASSPGRCATRACCRSTSRSPASSPRAWSPTRPTGARTASGSSRPRSRSSQEGATRRARLRTTGEPVVDRRHREDVEVQAQRRRAGRHRRHLRRRRRAAVRALRLAAGARRAVDHGRRRGRLAAGEPRSGPSSTPSRSGEPPRAGAADPSCAAPPTRRSRRSPTRSRASASTAPSPGSTSSSACCAQHPATGGRRRAREALSALARLIAPFAPHLAEECWQRLGEEGLVAAAPWPTYDPALAEDEERVLPVQINGKRRGEIRAGAGASEAEVEKIVLDDPEIARRLEGLSIRQGDRGQGPHRQHRGGMSGVTRARGRSPGWRWRRAGARRLRLHAALRRRRVSPRGLSAHPGRRPAGPRRLSAARGPRRRARPRQGRQPLCRLEMVLDQRARRTASPPTTSPSATSST